MKLTHTAAAVAVAAWSFSLGAVATTSPPACAAEPAWSLSAPEVSCFGYVEAMLALPEAVAGNPFVGADLSGEFTAPGGATAKVDGFCDSADGRVFRIRFMPREAGAHRFRLRFRSGAQSLTHAGEFTAREGEHPGLVEVDPEHPHHFRYSRSGEHFYWNSTTTYWLLGWQDEAVIRESLARLARLGVNRIRVALSGRTASGDRWKEPAVQPSDAFQLRLEPWPAARPQDVANPGYDVTRFNVAHFAKAERMLAAASELGIQASLIFHLDGADAGVDPFGKERRGDAHEQRYYRYAVARFAPFANVMWDVTNEWHLFRDEAWVDAMGRLIDRHDPYDHLTSVHGHGAFPFAAAPWVDYAMFQSWDEHGGYRFIRDRRREFAAAGRPLPVVNEEYGYEDHYPYPWGEARRWPARTADTRRRLAWEIAMAGGYQTTGERADVPGQGGWLTGRGNEEMTMLAGYAHLRGLFERMPWWKLEPQPEPAAATEPAPPEGAGDQRAAALPPLVADPLCLAEEGVRYVVYLPRGGAATLPLPPGRYQWSWYNPRTGESGEAMDAAVEAGRWTTPRAADALDWVLLVERRDVGRQAAGEAR